MKTEHQKLVHLAQHSWEEDHRIVWNKAIILVTEVGKRAFSRVEETRHQASAPPHTPTDNEEASALGICYDPLKGHRRRISEFKTGTEDGKGRRTAAKYREGDLVAIKKTPQGPGLKLKPKFMGPYKIVKIKPKDT
ncbi:hypothetical protein Trydic_g2598 [Trypoxylus dichotomus]